MDVWTAIVAIVTITVGSEFIIRVIKTATRFSENALRIKNGYPTLDGSTPLHYVEPEEIEQPGERLQ
jgi:hypothetical protein